MRDSKEAVWKKANKMKPFQVKGLERLLCLERLLYLDELHCLRRVHCLMKPGKSTQMGNPMGGPKLRKPEELCVLDKPREAHQLRNRPWGHSK